MAETVLLGRGRQMVTVPEKMWAGHLDDIPAHARQRLSFMTEDHHRVRYFVVRELPAHGRPIQPAAIAQALGLPLEKTEGILAELERNIFFLVRDEQGAVLWAFPVTVAPTPHRLLFSTGERLYGA